MASRSVSDIATLANSDMNGNLQYDGEYVSGFNSRHDRFPNVKIFVEEEFTGREKLGYGGFGFVYKRRWRRSDGDNMIIAEKRMMCGSIQEEAKIALQREAEVLQSLNHPNIIQMLGILYGSDQFSLILEYAEYGNCSGFLKLLFFKKVNEEFLWPLKFNIALQVCEAMIYLHDRPLLHLDLKSTNVLIDKQLNAKLCDFGLSQMKALSSIVNSSRQTLMSHPKYGMKAKVAGGTLTHTAPERLQDVNTKPSTKSDVYSYGIFMWELLTSKEPYEYGAGHDLKNLIIGGQRPDRKLIPPNVPKEMKNVMTNAWDRMAEERPEFMEIRKELVRDPALYPNTVIRNSIIIVKNILEDTFVKPSHTDSRLFVNTPKRALNPNTTKSEGDSRQIRLPQQSSVFDDETMVKKPFQPPNSTSTSVNLRPAEFPTQPLSDLREEPNVSTRPTAASSSISTQDLQFSNNFSTEDTQPMITSAETSIEGKGKRSKWICIVAVISLIVVAAAVAVPVCWKLGCFKHSCAELSAGDHQRISCSHGSASDPYSGSVCSFSCESGFGILSGQANVTCQDNGDWTENPPVCSKLTSCPSLASPGNNGTLTCTDQFYEMSTCTFHCPSGSCLRQPGSSQCVLSSLGDDNISKTTCGRRTSTETQPKWSNSVVPYCERALYCKELGPVSSGKYQCTNPRLPVTPGQYTNGTVCQVVCNEGFGVQNPTTYYCEDSGVWNTTETVSCIQECPSPKVDNNTSFNCSQKLFVNSVCNFSCEANYVMIGPIRVACLRTGKWKEKFPKCICPPCLGGKHCDRSLKWNDTLQNVLNNYIQEKSFFYDDFPIKCYQRKFGKQNQIISKENFLSNAGNQSCVCRDLNNNAMKQCNDYNTLEETCITTLSTFIRSMVYAGRYKLPCDANLMPPPCPTK